jgi:IclR family pca regulon transcriptional regulator
MEAELSRDHVGSLRRGLAVMEVLAGNPSGMTLSEVAVAAGLTRAGARRLLLTLVATGYADKNERRFSLSPRLLTVVRSWLQETSLWTHAEPFMREVATELNESCSAAVLAGEDVVYVARVPGRTILSVTLHVGTRLPAWCTSMGRVLLSDMPQPQLQAFLAAAAIEPRTRKSIVDRERLAAEIEKVAAAGFAIVDEELEIGLRSIAVPLRDQRRRIVAALNVSTQASRYTTAEMKRVILPRLRSAADSIENFFLLQ